MSEGSPKGKMYSCASEHGLHMFSFPPSERCLNNDREDMMNALYQDSSVAQNKNNESKFAEYRRKVYGPESECEFSFDGSVSAPLSSDIQSSIIVLEKVMIRIFNFSTII
jgi:hypothetical protein